MANLWAHKITHMRAYMKIPWINNCKSIAKKPCSSLRSSSCLDLYRTWIEAVHLATALSWTVQGDVCFYFNSSFMITNSTKNCFFFFFVRIFFFFVIAFRGDAAWHSTRSVSDRLETTRETRTLGKHLSKLLQSRTLIYVRKFIKSSMSFQIDLLMEKKS